MSVACKLLPDVNDRVVGAEVVEPAGEMATAPSLDGLNVQEISAIITVRTKTAVTCYRRVPITRVWALIPVPDPTEEALTK